MKRLLFVCAALTAAGCGHDYAKSAPQIPVGPTIADKPAPQASNLATATPAPVSR